MQVIISDEARANLADIEQYIGSDNPKRALSFVSELRMRIKQIGRAPKSFPIVPGYETQSIRRRSYRDYLIFYRVESYRVVIIAVIHGARDYERMLSPDA